MPIIGSNVKVEVQATLETADTITAITKANPAVLSAAAHGWSNGDVIVLDISGMAELDGQAVRVANITAGTAELEGIDSTNFGTFTSGTAQKVATWNTFSLATAMNVDEQSVDEIDVTTLLDTQRKIAYGLLSAVKGSFNALWEATDTALVNLRAATKAKSPRVFRVTFADSSKVILNALVALGDSFQLEQGDAAKCTCSFTLQGRQMMAYST